jgi:hypothetical protein
MLRLIPAKIVVREGSAPKKDQRNEKRSRRREFLRVG